MAHNLLGGSPVAQSEHSGCYGAIGELTGH